ncbi:MAG: ArdC-like ssDNA-binding domain-containing protein [Phycisphaerales bacterium]
MNASDAKQLADQALDDLANALAQGNSDRLTAFLDTMARFHRYSATNLMLILTQRPDATRVAGFHAWRSMGRFVKKGEKGIVIFAPMRLKKRSAKETASGALVDDDFILRFRAVYVFDVAQTEGEPLPDLARPQGDAFALRALDRLRSLVAEKGIALEYADMPGGSFGLSCGGTIKLALDLASKPAEQFATLAHELAHELLHRDERRKELTKTIVETEAEAVAYAVCRAVGVDARDASTDYIRLYRGDAATLAESLSHIQRVAADIIAGVTADEVATV